MPKTRNRIVLLVMPMLTACLALAMTSLADIIPPGQGERHEHSADAIHGCARCKLLAAAGARRAGIDPIRDGRIGLQTPNAFDDTDVLHYNLDIEVDYASRWVGGSNTMTVKSLIDGLTMFTFHLADNFNVPVMTVNGTPVVWNQTNGSTIEVTLDRAYNTGEVFDLYVEYDGNPQSGGWGSINFTTQNGQPLVDTLSEAWFAYTWWPAKDDNRDKATADLSYTVPDDMVVASNGSLVETISVPGNKLKYHWRTNYQTAVYLVSMAITNYNFYEETWDYGTGTMPMTLYVFPADDTSSHRNEWANILNMLTAFSDKYGLYPFTDEKYGCYQFSFGGGMEHQTITGQTYFWGSYEYINAHELSHQWWGDMITCATWSDIWLNEGFATFSEALWYENEPGGGGSAAYQSHMDWRRPSRVGDSVYVYDPTDMGRIFSSTYTYRKGAWVVHQLRWVVGDDAFFNDVLPTYRSMFEYDSAVTDDLLYAAETATGMDLDWFFDQWVYDIGAPAYQWGYRETDLAVNGQKYVELYVKQVQSSSYPIFTMPIEIVTDRNTGTEASHVVWNDEEAEHFLIPVDELNSGVSFDPNKWILWTSAQNTGFVDGPPKVVQTWPAPGEVVTQDEAGLIKVLYHMDVVTELSDYTLVGDHVGPVELVGFNYYVPDFFAQIAPARALPMDTYTLTISDAVTAWDGGLALDGEIDDPMDAASLPSGEGLAGGSAVIRFTVGPEGVSTSTGTKPNAGQPTKP
jgi:aminopeptidase N